MANVAAWGGEGSAHPRAAAPYSGRSASAAQSSCGVQGHPRGAAKPQPAGLKGDPPAWKPVANPQTALPHRAQSNDDGSPGQSGPALDMFQARAPLSDGEVCSRTRS